MYDMEFQDLGSIGKEMSVDERKAVVALSKGTIYENGRYTVPSPWKETKPNLLNNFNSAHRRAQLLKKRFARTPGLYEKYKAIIDDHIRKGYVERVEPFDEGDERESWFLPHHPVFNPKKPGKVRAVFDCAARYV